MTSIPHGHRTVHGLSSARRKGHFKTTDLNTTYEIYVMDADGGNEQRLTSH